CRSHRSDRSERWRVPWETWSGMPSSSEALSLADGLGQIDAANLGQVRLVVEKVDLGGRAVLEQVDDTLGCWREVRESGQAARGLGVFGEKRRESGDAEARARTAEEVSPR